MPTLTETARAIRDRAKTRPKPENRPTNPTKPPAGQLTLAAFSESGRVVVIYSDVLDCEVVFAADNAHVSENETRPVYRARELAAIWGDDGKISADGLRTLHEVKTRFAAEIEEEREPHA